MMHFSFGNYIADLLNVAPNYILPLLVLSIAGSEANAYFYIAFTISSITFMLPVAVCMSLFAEGSHEIETLRNNVLKSTKFIFILLFPVVTLAIFYGDKVLLLFGGMYSENAFTLLSLMIISSIPITV